MSEKVRVAVIGGGIVGCSVLAALTRAGWTDCLLVERRELTSGSTWHAAGNTTYFGPYAAMTRLFIDSIRLYTEAEQETGQSVSFHKAGSLRLATSRAELEIYKSLVPQYEALGVPFSIVSNEEAGALHPLLNTTGLYGAASTPTDGHVDSYGATMAMAKQAMGRGAQIWRQCPVERVESVNGTWRLHTAKGQVTAEHVVVAASFWARELLEPLGLNLPLYALQHHEVVTDAVADLEELDFEVPTIRDSVAPANIRQEGHGFLCGVYEKSPKFWAIDGIPKDFGEELLPAELHRLEPHLEKVMARVPAFGDAGIRAVNNGPICYTPDGAPLLGPVEGHEGLWLATGFTIGIGTGGGSGHFLANWIASGQPPFALPQVYPARFSNNIPRETCLAQIVATYEKGYTLT